MHSIPTVLIKTLLFILLLVQEIGYLWVPMNPVKSAYGNEGAFENGNVSCIEGVGQLESLRPAKDPPINS